MEGHPAEAKASSHGLVSDPTSRDSDLDDLCLGTQSKQIKSYEERYKRMEALLGFLD
jgi:hypothetical protein